MYMLRKLVEAAITFLGASLLVFVLVRLTGDPATALLPPETPPEVVEQFRATNGLDRPLVAQYATFLGNALTGDFGASIRYRQPVADLILQRLPATLILSFAAIFLAALVALPLGVLSALHRGSWIDSVGRFIGLFGQSVPTFYLGIILILVFSVGLRVLPSGGYGAAANMVLPVVSLAFFLIPVILRVTRGSVLEALGQDFVLAWRTQGMPRGRIVRQHVIKGAALPVVTILGLQLGVALSGAIVTETVFSWPGLGQLLVGAISTRDFPVVQGIVILAVAFFLVINTVIDLSYRLLDPRIGERA